MIAIAAIGLWPAIGNLSAGDIADFTPENPILAAILLVALFCIKNVFMVIPLAALYVAAGLLFPTKWAIFIVYIGLTCEMSIGYHIGTRMGTNQVNSLIKERPKAGAFFELLGRNNMVSCFLTRLVPMPLPLDMVSLFFGATGVPFHTYLLCSLLGTSPVMIPTVIAGRAITNPLSAKFILPFAISLGISALVLVVYTRVMKALRHTDLPPSSEP